MHGDLHVPWQPQDPGGLLRVKTPRLLSNGKPKVCGGTAGSRCDGGGWVGQLTSSPVILFRSLWGAISLPF